MKHAFKLVLVLAIIAVSNQAVAQDKSGATDYTIRAAEGDSVRIYLNHVKSDKRDQFEEWMDFFFQHVSDLVAKGLVTERDIENMNSTRVLTPTHSSSDSTYTYIFVADPWIGNVATSIRYFFSKTYNDEEVAKYTRMFSECLAKPQEAYKSLQSKQFSY